MLLGTKVFDGGLGVSGFGWLLLVGAPELVMCLRGDGVSTDDSTDKGVEVVEEVGRGGVQMEGPASSSGRFWGATRATGVETSMILVGQKVSMRTVQ